MLTRSASVSSLCRSLGPVLSASVSPSRCPSLPLSLSPVSFPPYSKKLFFFFALRLRTLDECAGRVRVALDRPKQATSRADLALGPHTPSPSSSIPHQVRLHSSLSSVQVASSSLSPPSARYTKTSYTSRTTMTSFSHRQSSLLLLLLLAFVQPAWTQPLLGRQLIIGIATTINDSTPTSAGGLSASAAQTGGRTNIVVGTTVRLSDEPTSTSTAALATSFEPSASGRTAETVSSAQESTL